MRSLNETFKSIGRPLHLASVAADGKRDVMSILGHGSFSSRFYRVRIREEIRAARALAAEHGNPAVTIEDLDGMQYTRAAIKVRPLLGAQCQWRDRMPRTSFDENHLQVCARLGRGRARVEPG